MSDLLFNMLVSFVMLGAIYVPLERSFGARAQGHLRLGLGLDLLYFALQMLLMLSVFIWLQD